MVKSVHIVANQIYVVVWENPWEILENRWEIYFLLKIVLEAFPKVCGHLIITPTVHMVLPQNGAITLQEQSYIE